MAIHRGPVSPDHYGVWVHYPWSRRLVHILDEAEFALVRTDRNRNKITREEQEKLSALKVGVIGLSVGRSICVTMAFGRVGTNPIARDDAAVADQQRDVRPEALLQLRALRGKIHGTATIGVDTAVVTPCAISGWPWRNCSRFSPSPACEWTSMNPGVISRSAASITRAARAPGRRNRSYQAARIPMSARIQDCRAIHDATVLNQDIKSL